MTFHFLLEYRQNWISHLVPYSYKYTRSKIGVLEKVHRFAPTSPESDSSYLSCKVIGKVTMVKNMLFGLEFIDAVLHLI